MRFLGRAIQSPQWFSGEDLRRIRGYASVEGKRRKSGDGGWWVCPRMTRNSCHKLACPVPPLMHALQMRRAWLLLRVPLRCSRSFPALLSTHCDISSLTPTSCAHRTFLPPHKHRIQLLAWGCSISPTTLMKQHRSPSQSKQSLKWRKFVEGSVAVVPLLKYLCARTNHNL